MQRSFAYSFSLNALMIFAAIVYLFSFHGCSGCGCGGPPKPQPRKKPKRPDPTKLPTPPTKPRRKCYLPPSDAGTIYERSSQQERALYIAVRLP